MFELSFLFLFCFFRCFQCLRACQHRQRRLKVRIGNIYWTITDRIDDDNDNAMIMMMMMMMMTMMTNTSKQMKISVRKAYSTS